MFDQLSDGDWLDVLRRSQHDPSLALPAFPPELIQQTFVGRAGDSALDEAFFFYRAIVARLGDRLRDMNILDFGVGWGRIIRMFLREAAPARLYGVDVDPQILQVCAETKVPGTLLQIAADGTLPFPDNHFGCAYAFSVFSHLSEPAAIRWMHELIRVTGNGGVIVFTSTDLRFLDQCLACFNKTEGRNAYEEMQSKIFPDPADAKARFLAGQHAFAAVGGAAAILKAEDYGWAAVPPEWIRHYFGAAATLDDYTMPGEIVSQSIFRLTVTK